MSIYKIVSRFDDRTLYECEAESLLKALEAAVKSSADLHGATINWQSHDMIAELLIRKSGDDIEKRKVAGLILASRDWCWNRFVELSGDPLWQWAIDTLSAYVIYGDDAPEILKDARKVEL